MAIKFTAKDLPKTAVPAPAPKKPDAKVAVDGANAAEKDATPDGTDLFDADAKAPAGKRKPNGFRR